MRRGDIYLADLEPARGSEANKTRRPVVIVSSDRTNVAAERFGVGLVTVVPMTSNVGRVLDFHVFLPAERTGTEHDSKAQVELIRAISTERFVSSVIGVVPPELMARLDAALKLHLALP